MFGLKKRIASLEEYLGVRYAPKTTRHDYDGEHLPHSWGSKYDDLEKRIKKLEGKKKAK